MRHLLTMLALLLLLDPAYAGMLEVRIENMHFVPAEIRIKPGDTVVWKSYQKRGYHTVWFKREGLSESEPMFPDESWQRKFERKGEYPYECGPHPEMTGRVIVE